MKEDDNNDNGKDINRDNIRVCLERNINYFDVHKYGHQFWMVFWIQYWFCFVYLFINLFIHLFIHFLLNVMIHY